MKICFHKQLLPANEYRSGRRHVYEYTRTLAILIRRGESLRCSMSIFYTMMGSFYLNALSIMIRSVWQGEINVRYFVSAFGEHVLHGEAASSYGERVPASLGLRASTGQSAAGARQLCHLHVHQGSVSRGLS